mgnify:CR=1 FL=1
MKEIRILHTGDWHADSDPKKQDKLENSLDQMLEYVQNVKVNAIVHTGDIWEKKQNYAEKSGVPLVVNYLKALATHVDFVFITKGNNSHDEVGSVSLLHQLEPNIYAFEYPAVLGVDSDGEEFAITDLLRSGFAPNEFNNPQYIVSLVPYPTKASFISNDSIDNNNTDFIEKFEQVFELIADRTAEFTCPKVLGFHGNVVGSRLSSGQTLVSQDIMVAPRSLQLANHDYYALGHIHMRQEVAPNMVYSGSIYNKSWGETEQKSFEIVEMFTDMDDDETFVEVQTERIFLTSARPMVKIEAEFVPNDPHTDFIYDNDLSEEGFANAEVRIRVAVKENDRKLFTEDREAQLKRYFGQDVKIELNVIPDERESRSQEIMNAKTLLDEVEEYAKVVKFEMTPSMKEKVLSIAGEEVEV